MPSMEDTSPVKHKPTTKVIDSLHSEIDSLKNELESVKLSHDNYKKNYAVASKKNDLFVDQLANAKHENDMINALLKRKERRIVDLEDQYNELSSTNESLTLNNKNMKIRCDNLQESSSSSIAEYERLKIAYDALIASQVEYKRHYEKELNDLTSRFEAYKKQNLEDFNSLNSKLANTDKDIDTIVESLTNKRKTMDNLYVNKNKTVLEFLSKLAKIAKLHGQESKVILQDTLGNIKLLIEKYPDLPMKLSSLDESEVNIEKLLNESNDALSNSSFDEDTTLTNSPDLLNDVGNNKGLNRNNSIAMKKRKNKRNSIRFDSKNGSDLSNWNSQSNVSRKTSNNKQIRASSFETGSRLPTPPSHNDHDTVKDIIYANNASYQNQQQNNHKTRNSSNKSKRRSMHGNNINNNGLKSNNKSGLQNKNLSEVST